MAAKVPELVTHDSTAEIEDRPADVLLPVRLALSMVTWDAADIAGKAVVVRSADGDCFIGRVGAVDERSLCAYVDLNP